MSKDPQGEPQHENKEEKRREGDGQLPPHWLNPDPREPKPGKHGK
ncbi:hypothetical protein [Amycolatopsis sp. NPDC059021]